MSETGREYQDSIELAAYQSGEKLDGFDIHRQANYNEVSASFILAIPEPRRIAFGVVNPENFKVGDDVTVDVIRGNPDDFKREQHRLQQLQIEMNRLSDEIESIRASKGTMTAPALDLLEQYNFCRSKMVNPNAGHEFGEIAAIESYNNKKNIIVLKHALQYNPYPGGTCVKIEYWTKKYANARIADMPESKWERYIDIEREEC